MNKATLRKSYRFRDVTVDRLNQLNMKNESEYRSGLDILYSEREIVEEAILFYYDYKFGKNVFDSQVEKFNNQLALTLNTILTQTEKNLADYISVAIRENQITMEVMFVILNAMNITASNPQEISQKMINNSWIYETVSEAVNEKNKFIKEESEEW